VKLLFITDDIRLNTGVGIQARKLTKGLANLGYEVVVIGCALNHKDLTPVKEDVLIYPVNIGREYGDKNFVRYVIDKEKPDFIIPFSDPRFFGYLFKMDDEIREYSRIVFYHTWDNDPFPKFNLPFYESCDALVMISKFSYELMKENIKDKPIYCVQHGFDPTEFYPLPQNIIRKERENLKNLVNMENLEFIIFWNNRNIIRKRVGDVLMIFKEFHKTHPHSLLLMNTDPIDVEGIDILQFHRDLGFEKVPVVYNFEKVKSDRLNLFYNIADVTFTITYNEGFGLCVGESLCAGTPVVATKTGGMTEQLTDGNKVYGILMEPDVRTLFGVPGASYIYQDYVSFDTAINSLHTMYKERKTLKETIGKEAREHIISHFHINQVIEKWDKILKELYEQPKSYKRVKLTTI